MTASSEIQAAARRVIEENKRLRQMLKSRGASDSEIDGSSPESPQFPTPASVLEEMVETRKPCRPCGDESGNDSGRSSRCASGPPVQPIQQAAKIEAQMPALDQQAPRSAYPETSNLQQISPAPDAGSWLQTSLPPTTYGIDDNLTGTVHQFTNEMPDDYALSYENPVSWLDSYPTPDMASVSSQPDLQQFPETSSCQVAADTIRTFKPEAGYELEQELGCRGLGQDCQVLNTHIFRVMDRYTDSAV